MTTQLVNGLTVDELKEVIANVVDARLNNFLSVRKEEEAKAIELHKREFLSEHEEKVIQAKSGLKHFKNLLASKVEVKKENPWLKIAGMYRNNADLFEEVVGYIEASHQEILEEDLD